MSLHQDIRFKDLQLHAQERGAETWNHNALTLASSIRGAAGHTLLTGMLNIVSIGLMENAAGASQSLVQGLQTSASRCGGPKGNDRVRDNRDLRQSIYHTNKKIDSLRYCARARSLFWTAVPIS